jgi:hypothetical protein
MVRDQQTRDREQAHIQHEEQQAEDRRFYVESRGWDPGVGVHPTLPRRL